MCKMHKNFNYKDTTSPGDARRENLVENHICLQNNICRTRIRGISYKTICNCFRVTLIQFMIDTDSRENAAFYKHVSLLMRERKI